MSAAQQHHIINPLGHHGTSKRRIPATDLHPNRRLLLLVRHLKLVAQLFGVGRVGPRDWLRSVIRVLLVILPNPWIKGGTAAAARLSRVWAIEIGSWRAS